MPNWCENNLNIFGESEDVKEFVDFFTNNENEFELQFNKIVPVLENMKDNIDWRYANWGTKWEPDVTGVDTSDRYITIDMLTAWSPPINAILAMSKKFKPLDFRLKYSEDGIGFMGFYHAYGGKEMSDKSISTI